MTSLSRPQLTILRYVKGHQLYAADINSGNGNRRRTLLSLLKLGMLSLDPIYRGHIELTEAGKQQLQQARDHENAAKVPPISARRKTRHDPA
jgi:hypothetical protein